jgi:hypothetical protein
MKSVLAVLAVFVLSGAGQALAECISDCSDSYQSDMAACQDQYGDPGEEAQLQQCIDDAQTRFEQCGNACETSD